MLKVHVSLHTFSYAFFGTFLLLFKKYLRSRQRLLPSGDKTVTGVELGRISARYVKPS